MITIVIPEWFVWLVIGMGFTSGVLSIVHILIQRKLLKLRMDAKNGQ